MVKWDEVRCCVSQQSMGETSRKAYYYSPPDKTFVQYVTKPTIFDYLYIHICHVQLIHRN